MSKCGTSRCDDLGCFGYCEAVLVMPRLTPSEEISILKQSMARKFETIADLIESDPEWFQDETIDDADIMEGLRIAAKFIRSAK